MYPARESSAYVNTSTSWVWKPYEPAVSVLQGSQECNDVMFVCSDIVNLRRTIYIYIYRRTAPTTTKCTQIHSCVLQLQSAQCTVQRTNTQAHTPTAPHNSFIDTGNCHVWKTSSHQCLWQLLSPLSSPPPSWLFFYLLLDVLILKNAERYFESWTIVVRLVDSP